MGNQYFQFKQFLINQDKCAMKVGTDSVLLAGLTNIVNIKTILDVGTGTGILSLMLAQKNTELKIEAIEIDKAAFEQAKINFKESKFANQIQVYLCALQLFNTNKKYDLIITNPPYFISKNNYSISNLQRAKARHDEDLPFELLIKHTYNLLTDNGQFNLILPIDEAIIFKKLALQNGYHCKQTIFIKPKENKVNNRAIMVFVKYNTHESITDFVIYKNDNSQTNSFKELVEAYYL